jgi:hypothetical protein
MAGNPNIPLGTLNRILATFQCVDSPELNAIAGNFGKSGIRINFDTAPAINIPTMTGGVPSGEPYQMATVTMSLLKTQSLGNLFKQRIENNTSIGDCNITPDSTVLSPYLLQNCSIVAVDPLAFDGTDPVYMVHVQGFYQTNSNLWG